MPKSQKTAAPAPMPAEVASSAIAEVLPPPTGMTRETYTPETLAKVLWEVASGKTLKAACAEVGIHFTTFYYWLLRAPEIERMWRAARRLAAQSMFDRALEQVNKLIDRSGEISGSEVRALDVAQGALRGMAEVMNPSEFSNRQAVTPPVMVKIVTTLNLRPGSDVSESDRADVYEIAARAVEVSEEDSSLPRPAPPKPQSRPGAPAQRKPTGGLVKSREVRDG